MSAGCGAGSGLGAALGTVGSGTRTGLVSACWGCASGPGAFGLAGDGLGDTRDSVEARRKRAIHVLAAEGVMGPNFTASCAGRCGVCGMLPVASCPPCDPEARSGAATCLGSGLAAGFGFSGTDACTVAVVTGSACTVAASGAACVVAASWSFGCASPAVSVGSDAACRADACGAAGSLATANAGWSDAEGRAAVSCVDCGATCASPVSSAGWVAGRSVPWLSCWVSGSRSKEITRFQILCHLHHQHILFLL